MTESSERRIIKARLEVVTGPMFSGKTDELIRRLVREQIARRDVLLLKPSIDQRYGGGAKAHSHSGSEFPATLFDKDNPREIIGLVKPFVSVVGIEEVQFCSPEIVDVCEELLASGKRVIVGGLPTDFRGEPFGAMPFLMAKADYVDRFHAVCMVCGDEADFTQRLVNGNPARYDDPIVVVGAAEMYEARCRQHHEVPGRPNK